MDNTSKTSIAAIIFVIIYFLFIIFISLFKGINLYDINLRNINIKNLFIKLDKKLILNIKDIKITPSKKSTQKEALKLHNIFFYTTKILPLFKEIKVENIYQNNSLLLKKISVKANNLYIQAPKFLAKGHFIIYKNYSIVYLDTLKYQDYTLKNTSIFSNYTKNSIFINIKSLFKKEPIYLALKANDNYIYYSFYTKHLHLNYQKNNIYLKNLDIQGGIDTFFKNFNANINNSYFSLKNKELNLTANNIKGNLKNNILNLNIKLSNIKYPDYINNLKLNNILLNLDLKNRSLLSEAKKAKLKYKEFNISTKNIAFNYSLNNNNFFFHTTNLKLNNEINATSKEIIVSKLPKLYLYIQDNKVTQKYFNLQNKIITGDTKKIILSDVIGKILSFNTKITSPKIDLTKKTVTSKRILFNKIPFTNTIFSFNKRPFILKSQTSTLFDKNILSTLKYFNINIPLLQTAGENNLTFCVYISNKLENINYNLISKKSKFIINNEINLSIDKLKAKGDLNYTKISIKTLKIPMPYFNTNLDSNVSVNIKEKYLNAFAFIKYLNIDKYINIKNFYEKMAYDLRKNIIFLLNSSILINLNTNEIFIYSLKNILNYSVFNKIIDNGDIKIDILKKEIDILANIIIKYPLFLNKPNPKLIKAKFKIEDNNISITNSFINTKIINFEKIDSKIKDVDINISSLIKIIDDINEINKIISPKDTNKTDNNLEVEIDAKNTNFIYKNHKFLTQTAHFHLNKEMEFNATYKKSSLNGYTKDKYLLIEGKNYNKDILVPLLDFFKNFNDINLDFVLVRSPQDFLTGKVYINKGTIKELGVLNNIIAFINTIPSILSLQTPGFSAKGYKIKNGYISYLFYNNILYFKQIKIKGKNLDFIGKGYVDLNKNYIKMKIDTILKIKLKKIPIIGKGISYILFGKDGYLHVNIFVKGDLNNPKVTKDLGGGIIESPIKLFKRIITLPFNLF